MWRKIELGKVKKKGEKATFKTEIEWYSPLGSTSLFFIR